MDADNGDFQGNETLVDKRPQRALPLDFDSAATAKSLPGLDEIPSLSVGILRPFVGAFYVLVLIVLAAVVITLTLNGIATGRLRSYIRYHKQEEDAIDLFRNCSLPDQAIPLFERSPSSENWAAFGVCFTVLIAAVVLAFGGLLACMTVRVGKRRWTCACCGFRAGYKKITQHRGAEMDHL